MARLVLESMQQLMMKHTFTEEKVDGANLGISFGTLDGPPRCQKRGHWVTHKSEQQFSKLESWLAQHAEDLRGILGEERKEWSSFPCTGAIHSHVDLNSWTHELPKHANRCATHCHAVRNEVRAVRRVGRRAAQRSLRCVARLVPRVRRVRQTGGQVS
jgi:hypothetical protein